MVSNCYSNAKIDKIIILNALLFVFYRFRLVVPLVAGVDMGLSVVEVCSLLLTKTDFRWWIISVLWLV